MRLIAFMFRSARRLFLLSLIFSIIGGIATTGLLISINAALEQGKSARGSFLWVFILLALAAMTTRTAAALFLSHLGQGALLGLRLNLSRQILGTTLRKLEEVGPGRILAILTDDVLNITNFISNVPVLCTNTVIALTCLIYMGWVSATLLAVVLAFMVIGILTYEFLTRVANRHITDARQDHNELLRHFRSLLDGMKELKLHRRRREAFFSDVLTGTAGNYRKHMLEGLKVYTVAVSWGELLMFLAIGLVIFFSSIFSHISIQAVVSFVFAMLYLIGPLETIMNSLPQIGRANVALKSVEEMKFTLSSCLVAEERVSQLPEQSLKSLELCDVTFSYRTEKEGERFVLGPLNLAAFPGEIVFITGGNGSGKSTLAKIVVGLYQPEAGHILLNGRVITEDVLDEYRQHFAAVFSDFHVFDMLLGLESPALDEAANRFLQQLELEHKVKVRDGSFSTTDLSQGQRKRLALLTAYLEDRAVYLFDEWAADQDPLFRNIFYYQILPELRTRGKAVFVISHDGRYFHVADRIIKLEYGQIVADEVPSTRSLEQF